MARQETGAALATQNAASDIVSIPTERMHTLTVTRDIFREVSGTLISTARMMQKLGESDDARSL